MGEVPLYGITSASSAATRCDCSTTSESINPPPPASYSRAVDCSTARRRGTRHPGRQGTGRSGGGGGPSAQDTRDGKARGGQAPGGGAWPQAKSGREPLCAGKIAWTARQGGIFRALPDTAREFGLLPQPRKSRRSPNSQHDRQLIQIGSYSRLIDCVYHSTLDLMAINKRRRR